MSRSAAVNTQITLRVRFLENGVPFTPYSVSAVNIYAVAVGGVAIASLTPTEEETGLYSVAFSASDYGITSAVTLYDEWTWTANEGMSSKTQRYSFELTEAEEEAEDTTTEALSVVCRTPPSWVRRIGITRIEDLGSGSGIFIAWEEARPHNYLHPLHYNIYYSTSRLSVFSEGPKATTAERSVSVYLNDPGTVYYFAVRATEYSIHFDLEQMEQIGVHTYSYPDAVYLTEDLDIASHDGYSIPVDSVEGFPEVGELLIGTEVLYYAGIDRVNNEFIVPDDGRGYESTNIDQHREGAAVTFWGGVTEENTIIRQGIATWHQQVPRNLDAIGETNVGADGYRTISEDLVTTDLSASEENNEDFSAFDFCGYHRPSLQSTFSGDCVGSYVGGEFNGSRGLFLNDRNLARLDTMLQTSGEPVVLLRRKWTGVKCSCFGLRREHQRTRCPLCYGTGFSGGYDRYINTRPISERWVNTEGYILIRVYPYTDDLKIEQSQGLVQPVELQCWTIAIPTIKDRDIIIRFDEDFVEEFRYEVLNTNRNKILMNSVGSQTFVAKRLDKTDVIYTYDTSISS